MKHEEIEVFQPDLNSEEVLLLPVEVDPTDPGKQPEHEAVYKAYITKLTTEPHIKHLNLISRAAKKLKQGRLPWM